MRTSLNEIKNIEESILKADANSKEALIWKAQLLADPNLWERVRWQQKVYLMIRYFGRRKMKSELSNLHSVLISDPDKTSFQKKVNNIFSTQ